MKGIIASCFLILTGLTGFAQTGLVVTSTDKVIGKNTWTNKDVVAREFIFPERIHETFLDSVSNCITLQLRGTSKNGKYLKNDGNLVLFDLSSRKGKWSKEVAYQMGMVEQKSNLIIQTIANKSYCLNYENGENLWEVKNTMYYVEPYQKVGIGYKYSSFSGPTNNLEGIDITNGNKIWQREINREYSWNNVLQFNDSTIIVVAAGLHAINLKNGSGWDYNAVTGDKDYSSTVLANTAGAVLGALTGSFVMTTGHDLVRDLVSNVLIDSTSIYFASKENIACLDHDGKVKWTVTLPKDLVSRSKIFKKDDTLYMINEGIAYMGRRELDYGTPFIAAFDTKTSKQIFFSTINGEKDQINGFKIINDTLSLVFKNRVSKYSMQDGTLITEKYIDTEKYGEIKYYVGKQVYVKNDSTYNILTLSDTTRQYVFTEKGTTLVLDHNLEIVNQIDYDQLLVNYLWDRDYKFLAKDNKTIVLDKDNKSIANLDISNETIKLGTKLYSIQGKSLVEIDLKEITRN